MHMLQFWKPESGFFGGFIMGFLLIVFLALVIKNRCWNPKSGFIGGLCMGFFFLLIVLMFNKLVHL